MPEKENRDDRLRLFREAVCSLSNYCFDPFAFDSDMSEGTYEEDESSDYSHYSKQRKIIELMILVLAKHRDIPGFARKLTKDSLAKTKELDYFSETEDIIRLAAEATLKKYGWVQHPEFTLQLGYGSVNAYDTFNSMPSQLQEAIEKMLIEDEFYTLEDYDCETFHEALKKSAENGDDLCMYEAFWFFTNPKIDRVFRLIREAAEKGIMDTEAIERNFKKDLGSIEFSSRQIFNSACIDVVSGMYVCEQLMDTIYYNGYNYETSDMELEMFFNPMLLFTIPDFDKECDKTIKILTTALSAQP